MFNEPNFDYEMFKLETEIDYGLDAVFPEVKEDYCDKLADPNFINSDYFEDFVVHLVTSQNPDDIDFIVDMIVSQVENHLIPKERADKMVDALLEFSQYGPEIYEKYNKEMKQEISEFNQWRVDLKKKENELLRGERTDDEVKVELLNSLVRTGAKVPVECLDFFMDSSKANSIKLFASIDGLKDAYFIKQGDAFILCTETSAGKNQFVVEPDRIELFELASAASYILHDHNQHLNEIDDKTFAEERAGRIHCEETETDKTKSGLVGKSFERVAEKYRGISRVRERIYMPHNNRREPPDPPTPTLLVEKDKDQNNNPVAPSIEDILNGPIVEPPPGNFPFPVPNVIFTEGEKEGKTDYETIIASIKNDKQPQIPSKSPLADFVLTGTPYAPDSYGENSDGHEENENEYECELSL